MLAEVIYGTPDVAHCQVELSDVRIGADILSLRMQYSMIYLYTNTILQIILTAKIPGA